jgi:dienelactone hydrolase
MCASSCWRWLALVLACASSLAHAEAEVIAIPGAGLSSSPTPLVGHLFKPAGSGPHPAIVMLHGCGGAYSRDGSINPRHRMWGEFLAASGYVSLLVDSFSSRNLKSICTIRNSERPIKEADRVGDAYAALGHLRQRQDVVPQQIGLLGWSHGGGSVMATITTEPGDEHGFAAAVAFYPGCTTRLKRADRFHPYAPLLLLIGEADDWTPSAPCVALSGQVSARGEPMSIVTYPDTFHDFDSPALAGPRLRKDVPNGVNPGRGVTVAPNPTAREDAKQRVADFLAGLLK